MFTDGSLVLLVSPSLPQSQEVFKKCLSAYRDLGRPKGVAGESALRLELDNGSRIISLPGSEKTNVGYACNMLIVDEAARTPSALIEAMLPTTAATNGDIVALSSPAGARGWFYELWRAEGVEQVWEKYEVDADQVPRISESFLEEQRAIRGERYVRQEFYCDFQADTDSFFNPEDLERALTLVDPEEPLWFPERN